MFRRRPGFQHRKRYARAEEPVLARGLCCPTAALQRGLDEIETLIEPIAAECDIGRVFPNRLDPVVGPDHVLAPDLKRAYPEQLRKVVHGAFDGEGGLRSAVAAKAAGGDHVGIDGVAIGLLVGAAICRERTAERGCERLAAMTAIGTRIGYDADLNGGQCPVAPGAKLDAGGHRMARRGGDELLLASELPHYGPPGLQRGEDTEIL